MKEKKQTERRILEKFVSNEQAKFRIGSITDGETPDFTIKTFERKKISIELTGLINKELKEKEEFRTAIVNRAWTLFKQKHQGNLNVHVVFSSREINCRRIE